MPHIKFVGFAPDRSPDEPGIFVDGDKLVATSTGYFTPQRQLVNFGTNTLPSQVMGGYLSNYLNGTQRVFAGTVTHLYEETGGPGGSWSEVDGGTTFAAPMGVIGGGWRFTTFGNVTIAQDGVDSPVAAPTVGNFAPIVPAIGGNDAMPTAKVIASISNNFVMLGNITVSPEPVNFPAAGDRWWASVQGDYTSWSPSVSTLCVTGRLLDTFGPITAIKTIGTNITFAAYKQQATYLGIFVGPPVVWQFIRISSLIGALTQESVVDIGNIHVFPSTDDFWSFDGNNVQRIDNPIKSFFFRTCNLFAVQSGTSNIIGSFDRVNDIVYWYFPSTSTAIDTWLAWNIRSNVWTKGTLPIEAAILPEAPVGVASQGIFTTGHQAQTLSGSANPLATFTTGSNGDPEKFFMVTRLRPQFVTFPTGAPTSVNVTGFTRVNLGDTPQQVNTAVPLSQYGWVNLRQGGRYHAFQFVFGTDCVIEGLDITGVEVGNR